jgi:hypothetical protein
VGGQVSIEDPVFGQLEFRDGWRGEITVPFLEQSFELTINNSLEFPPSDDERKTWQVFQSRQTQFAQAVPKAIMHYYQSNLEDLRMPYSVAEEAEFAPDVTEPVQMWALVKPLRWLWLEVGHDDETTAISIEFWAKWDEEHGLAITFYKDQIGVADGGAHWLDNWHYDLNGNRIEESHA